MWVTPVVLPVVAVLLSLHKQQIPWLGALRPHDSEQAKHVSSMPRGRQMLRKCLVKGPSSGFDT